MYREKGNLLWGLVGKPEGRPLGRLRVRWKDNIKAGANAVGWGGVTWINLAEDRKKWRAVVRK
jgi:hypothetical protein